MSVRAAAPPSGAAWEHWTRRSTPFAVVAAALATTPLSVPVLQGLLVVALAVGTFAALVLLSTEERLPVRRLVVAVLWGYAALALLTWHVGVGLLLVLVVLATTPRVRSALGAGEMTAGPLSTLSDRELLSRWSSSGDALQRSTERPDHALRIVGRREQLLEELDRRGLAHRCRP